MRAKQAGAEVQRFEIVKPLGSGGFGAVYEAVDRHSGRRVALKELTRVSPSTLFRFKHEFRALSDIHHLNLVRLEELLEQDGRWYIVMELIEGSELLSHVRPSDDPGFDEARLRSAFIGIADGLEALHAYGILHRDLKPSNVLVAPDGRTVLLDFGLATSVDSRGQSTHAAAVGTVLYMAPEQADGQKLGRATDWYAFGASLYEALTGRPPFDGDSAIRVVMEKMHNAPPHPSTIAAGLPEDLSELCMRLLQIAPQSRPRGREVLQVLRGEAAESPPVPETLSHAPARLFAGRDSELEHLERALARTHEGELRIVLIEGESGVGKSELVAEFLRRQEQLKPQTMALRGRCYENEQVSYKAFDGCIDELARHLRRLGKDATALMPAQAPLLAQLFPVLADVQPLIHARNPHPAADPTARRLQAFSALSGLLANLAEERPLILVIDDLQWADSESFRLLRAIVEGPARPPVLVLATVRPREELEGDLLTSLESVRDWTCTEVVSLYGLPKPQAEALAQALLGGNKAAAWASTIAIESRGHPLFLAELIHFSQSRDLSARGSLTLDAALEARIQRLDVDARAVLEMVAVAARPHSAQLFARALDQPRIEGQLSVLLGHKLLRTRRDQEVGCYHDRIRRVVTERIPSARLPHLHRRLALALAQDATQDCTEEARHWDLADDSERALDAYVRAAKQAFSALAFGRAEHLFARALELCQGPAHPAYADLTTERAHAVACAGRSAEAVALYQRASELAVGEEQRLRLRSRAALQLMLSGKFERGMDAARQLFAQIDVRIPKSDWAAVLVALWHRLRTRFRKDGQLPASRENARTRLVLELLSEHLGTLGSLRTSAFLAANAQYSRLALASGSRGHAGLAYGAHGWLVNARAGMREAAQFFAVGRQLGSQGMEDVSAQAELAMVEGSARLANFEWVEGTALLERAQELCQAHLADKPWALTYVRHQLGTAWFRMGEHAHLASKMDVWIQEAQERKDQLGVALLTGMGQGCIRHVMRGRLSVALAELEEAMAPLQQEPFSFSHLGQLITIPFLGALEGGRGAWEWLERHKKQHDAAFLLRTRFGREALMFMRIHAALGASATAGPSERKNLLAFVDRGTSKLRRQESPFTRATAELFAAQSAAARGDTERALHLVRQARTGLESTGDKASATASYLEGVLEGGAAGKIRRDEVLAFYASQGWVHPLDAVAMRLPILGLLETAQQPTSAQRAIIQHYEVVNPLGSGGFGSVMEARDTRSGEHVALKQLVSKSARALERFKQEFRALRDLNHPNLVRLDALFEDQGRCYIAMELVRGQSLVHYVRPDGKLDIARLRRAFSGLSSALRALHDAGLVHRDISPENISVGEDGRAVLLDFGLVAREGDPRDAETVGNTRYAPPEQLVGAAPHRSADAYALGSCLYQALTGKLPFDGHSIETAELKRTHRPAAPDVPEELRALAAYCLDLLAPLASARPTLPQLEPLLASQATLRDPRVQRPSLALALVSAAGDATHFKGRSSELRALHGARAEARSRFTLALVEGQSGLGKSALVAEFARQLDAESPHLWCLNGRCYENEQLSFKAFDGVVDELARRLRDLPTLDCEELLPKKAALLAQLFPVLGTVPAIAGAPKKGLPGDPGARRRAALAVFVELLERLARSRTLLISVDDLQWADAESLLLLQTLAGGAEALPLLMVATLRPREEVPIALRAALSALKVLPNTRLIALDTLAPADTRALAEVLLGGEVPDGVFARLIQESQGNPLFLRELAEFARDRDSSAPDLPLSLDEAFATRILRFDLDTRAFLATVALAEKPYPSHIFAAAVGQTEAQQRGPTNELLNQGFLRRRGDNALSCYHDRIRHVAVATLSDAERAKLCARLAGALDLHAAHEAAERARLWDAAGDVPNALAAHEQAGDAALAKLAFSQADQHYARALELVGERDDARLQRLTIQRAHALSRAGSTAHAAQLYKSAAQTAQGELAVRLRVLEAQHLLNSAQVKEGLAASSALLAKLGQPLPASDGAALARIVWDRVCVGVGGLEPRVRKAAPSDDERLLLEALPELDEPLQWVSFLGGSAMTMNYLRRALRHGDPRHIARGLAAEGLLRASSWRDDWVECFQRSRELMKVVDEPEVAAYINYMHGVSHLTWFNFNEASQYLEIAHKLAEEHCQGQRWLLTRIRANLGTVWWWTRRHRLFYTQMQAWLDEARAQSDNFAVMAMCSLGCGSLRFLMDDQPEKALSELEAAMKPWPKEPFSWGQWGAMSDIFSAHLYLGGRTGYDWYHQQKKFLLRQVIIKADFSKPILLIHQALHALHAIETPTAESTKPLIRECSALAERVAKHRSPWFRASAQEALALVSGLSGDRALALDHAQRAQAEYGKMLDPDPWKRAEYLRARLEGGSQGTLRAQAVLDEYAREGWQNPERALSMYLPCLDQITGART
jgi:serine/threonine protein kinase